MDITDLTEIAGQICDAASHSTRPNHATPTSTSVTSVFKNVFFKTIFGKRKKFSHFEPTSAHCRLFKANEWSYLGALPRFERVLVLVDEPRGALLKKAASSLTNRALANSSAVTPDPCVPSGQLTPWHYIFCPEFEVMTSRATKCGSKPIHFARDESNNICL